MTGTAEGSRTTQWNGCNCPLYVNAPSRSKPPDQLALSSLQLPANLKSARTEIEATLRDQSNREETYPTNPTDPTRLQSLTRLIIISNAAVTSSAQVHFCMTTISSTESTTYDKHFTLE